MSLAGLVHTLPLQADAPLPAGRPLHSRQLLGQTHHLSVADHGAPQAGAHVHPRAHRVLRPEGQAALADGVVALSRELLGAQEGGAGGVQETLGCSRKKRESIYKTSDTEV